MASQNLEEGTLFPFALLSHSNSLRFSFFLAECVLVEHFYSKCILYVSGKINKMKEPLSPFRKAVAASASSGSATGKILLCCECPFSVFCTRFLLCSISGQVVCFG
jgi:hypothetical protein